MPGIICLGDATTHGGRVETASSTLYFHGRRVALIGDLVSCPEHGTNAIIEGNNTMFEEGRQVVVNSCLCACGCRVISSQSDNNVAS